MTDFWHSRVGQTIGTVTARELEILTSDDDPLTGLYHDLCGLTPEHADVVLQGAGADDRAELLGEPAAVLGSGFRRGLGAPYRCTVRTSRREPAVWTASWPDLDDRVRLSDNTVPFDASNGPTVFLDALLHPNHDRRRQPLCADTQRALARLPESEHQHTEALTERILAGLRTSREQTLADAASDPTAARRYLEVHFGAVLAHRYAKEHVEESTRQTVDRVFRHARAALLDVVESELGDDVPLARRLAEARLWEPWATEPTTPIVLPGDLRHDLPAAAAYSYDAKAAALDIGAPVDHYPQRAFGILGWHVRSENAVALGLSTYELVEAHCRSESPVPSLGWIIAHELAHGVDLSTIDSDSPRTASWHQRIDAVIGAGLDVLDPNDPILSNDLNEVLCDVLGIEACLQLTDDSRANFLGTWSDFAEGLLAVAPSESERQRLRKRWQWVRAAITRTG